MNYDWNSFYGTFSQASGAIIGIIAAFLISKLLGISDELNNLNIEFQKKIVEYNKLKFAFSKRYFEWYVERKIESSIKLEDAINNGEYDDLNDEDIIKKLCYEFDLYDYPEGILESFKKVQKEVYKSNFPYLGKISSSKEMYAEISNEKEEIDKLEIEMYHLIDQFILNKQNIIDFKKKLKPLYMLLSILLISFPVTVLYPLHFLPIAMNVHPKIGLSIDIIMGNLASLKGLLLIVFFMLFEGIIIYFLFLLRHTEIEANKIMDSHKSDLTNVKSYSSYLFHKDSVGIA